MESVFAGVLVENEGVVLEQCEGLHYSVSYSPVCFLHSSTRKTFSGTLEIKKSQDYGWISCTTPQTITTKQDLEREVLKAAQDGYAVDYEEEFKGQVCVGLQYWGKR